MSEKAVLISDKDARFIWLDGYVTPDVADGFESMLRRLNQIKATPIVFYIKGPGGDPHSAFHIMSEIDNSDSHVSIVAHEYVGSACFTITQAGAYRLAMKGTKFSFHPAVMKVEPRKETFEMTQEELIGALDSLRLTDATQLFWFYKKGRPIKDIHRLFISNSTINLIKARKLKIIDDYYREEDFFRDLRIVRRILKAR